LATRICIRTDSCKGAENGRNVLITGGLKILGKEEIFQNQRTQKRKRLTQDRDFEVEVSVYGQV